MTGGICPWGKCPGGTCPGGSVLSPYKVHVYIDVYIDFPGNMKFNLSFISILIHNIETMILAMVSVISTCYCIKSSY